MARPCGFLGWYFHVGRYRFLFLGMDMTRKPIGLTIPYREVGFKEKSQKQRIIQLIKELKPAVVALDKNGMSKTTEEWFDYLIETIDKTI
jgi:hypothetical protein